MPTLKGKASFSSIHNKEDKLFNGGSWASASAAPSWAQLDFDAVYAVKGLKVKMAGSDVTSAGSRIALSLRGEQGTWEEIFVLENASINRGKKIMSAKIAPKDGKANRCNVLPPLALTLEQPVRAVACRLDISGHGWFAAQDMKLEGTRVAALPKAKKK